MSEFNITPEKVELENGDIEIVRLNNNLIFRDNAQGITLTIDQDTELSQLWNAFDSQIDTSQFFQENASGLAELLSGYAGLDLAGEDIENANVVNASTGEFGSVNTDNQTIRTKSRFQDGAFTEIGNSSSVSFSKRIEKSGTPVTWVTAARFNHNGSSNRAVIGTFDLSIATPTGTATVSSDSFIQFSDKDDSWGTTGSTTSIGSNVRLKVDDTDASILYLQVDLGLGNGFEIGIFEVSVTTNSNDPLVLDSNGFTN